MNDQDDIFVGENNQGADYSAPTDADLKAAAEFLWTTKSGETATLRSLDDRHLHNLRSHLHRIQVKLMAHHEKALGDISCGQDRPDFPDLKSRINYVDTASHMVALEIRRRYRDRVRAGKSPISKSAKLCEQYFGGPNVGTADGDEIPFDPPSTQKASNARRKRKA